MARRARDGMLNCETTKLIHRSRVSTYAPPHFPPPHPPLVMYLSSRSLVVLFALVVAATRGVADVPISPLPPHVTQRVAVVQVRVAPDHRDWTYQVGEPVRFKIAVVADNQAIDNATVSYQVGPELMPAELKTATVPVEGLT